MKGVLEFQLPEEDTEHRWAMEAGRYATTIMNFGNFLMRFDKHRDLNPTEKKILQEIREEWSKESCELRGVYD